MDRNNMKALRHMAKARGLLEAARSQWANGAFSGSICVASDAVREAGTGAIAWRGAAHSDSLLEVFRDALVAPGLVEHDCHAFWEDLEADRRKVEHQLHRFTAADCKEKLDQAEAFIKRLDRLLATGPKPSK